MVEIRNLLLGKRKSLNLTQEAVAEHCGFSREYYTMIERGVRTPTPQNAKKIANVLGFDWTLFYE